MESIACAHPNEYGAVVRRSDVRISEGVPLIRRPWHRGETGHCRFPIPCAKGANESEFDLPTHSFAISSDNREVLDRQVLFPRRVRCTDCHPTSSASERVINHPKRTEKISTFRRFLKTENRIGSYILIESQGFLDPESLSWRVFPGESRLESIACAHPNEYGAVVRRSDVRISEGVPLIRRRVVIIRR